jgi:glycosyltransferase involved in cell wall biosynthesis
VGRLDENKNPKIFIDLAKEFPECEFLMVGYGNEELIRDRPGNLKFFGKLPREETLRLISSSWVLVNTSESEGIPNVILEAMLCGTPVLSMNVRVEGIAYEVFCGDIKVLIERLRELLSSREKVLNLGENLRKEALRVFVEESRECWLRVILPPYNIPRRR